MPRIRNWHPVSHDFVRDPEVQELRQRFGDWAGYLWLEMLSIADRNLGHVKGDPLFLSKWARIVWVEVSPEVYEEMTHSERRLSKFSALRVRQMFEWCVERAWIVRTESGFYVCNYPLYHPRREQRSSPPSLPPSLPPKDRPLRGLVPELTPVELMESWNEICASEGLPRIEQQTNGRKAKAKARLKRYPQSEFWGLVLNKIIESDYLMGRRRKEGDTWKPDFDWLMKNDENPAKVVEGKYD